MLRQLVYSVRLIVAPSRLVAKLIVSPLLALLIASRKVQAATVQLAASIVAGSPVWLTVHVVSAWAVDAKPASIANANTKRSVRNMGFPFGYRRAGAVYTTGCPDN